MYCLRAVAIATTAAAMPIYRASLPAGMDRMLPEDTPATTVEPDTVRT